MSDYLVSKTTEPQNKPEYLYCANSGRNSFSLVPWEDGTCRSLLIQALQWTLSNIPSSLYKTEEEEGSLSGDV